MRTSLSLFGNYYIKFNRDSTDFSYPQSVNGLQNSPHPLYPSDATPKKHDLLLHVISSLPPLYSKANVTTFLLALRHSPSGLHFQGFHGSRSMKTRPPSHQKKKPTKWRLNNDRVVHIPFHRPPIQEYQMSQTRQT